MISADNPENEISLPFRFYEGSISVQGTVGGDSVTGTGFAELLHSYEEPEIQTVNPSGGEQWDGSQDVTWQLLNPDDGRPVSYDLEMSKDSLKTSSTIAQGITDTTYSWNISNFTNITDVWLKLTAYSKDTTLTDVVYTDSSFTVIPTGKQKNTKENAVKLYPHPASEFFKLRFKGDLKKYLSFDLYDVHGKPLIQTRSIDKNIYKIDIQELPAGLYFLNIHFKDNNTMTKAVLVDQ